MRRRENIKKYYSQEKDNGSQKWYDVSLWEAFENLELHTLVNYKLQKLNIYYSIPFYKIFLAKSTKKKKCFFIYKSLTNINKYCTIQLL